MLHSTPPLNFFPSPSNSHLWEKYLEREIIIRKLWHKKPVSSTSKKDIEKLLILASKHHLKKFYDGWINGCLLFKTILLVVIFLDLVIPVRGKKYHLCWLIAQPIFLMKWSIIMWFQLAQIYFHWSSVFPVYRMTSFNKNKSPSLGRRIDCT